MNHQSYFDCPTTWRVRGSIEDVYDILTHPLDFPRWWSRVYLNVTLIDPGDEKGIGRTVECRTRGRIPFSFRWRAQSLSNRQPYGFSLRATGEFVGEGHWQLSQDGEWVNIHYNWRVHVTKLWARLLMPLLKPVFVANHGWAMRQGLNGLEGELERRKC